MIWYNKSWFQIMRSWFDIISLDLKIILFENNIIFKSCVHDLTNKLWFKLNHECMIWNQDLLYQIMNVWFEIRIYYIKSWTYDLNSGFLTSNHKLMIWNQDLLYQIINAWFEIRIYYVKINDEWYHITKLYLVNNEKKITKLS